MPTLADVIPASAAGERRSAQPRDVRRQNVAHVMRTVLTQGPIARADVALLTGLAPGSVTKLTARLVAAGLLREEPTVLSYRQPGRPRVPVSIDPRYYVLGLHVGLLGTTIGVVDLTGRIVTEVTLPHDGETSFERISALAVRRIGELVSETGPDRILGLGASTGGWVDPGSGLVVEHPMLGWRNASLRTALAKRLDHPVLLDNTVRALALAETWFGVGKDVRSLLHLFVGTIVGAGIVTDGRMHRGPRSAAGYLDHLPIGIASDKRCHCGRYDCLQAVASDVAVMADARRSGLLAEGRNLDDLAALALAGNRQAHALLETRARQVGYALALLVEILNPDRVVLGGGVADHLEYLPHVRGAMIERLHRPLHTDTHDFVRATSFGRQAVTLASATLFLDAYYRDPMAFPPLARAAAAQPALIPAAASAGAQLS